MKTVCAAVFYTHVNDGGTEGAGLIREIAAYAIMNEYATHVTRKIVIQSSDHDRLDRWTDEGNSTDQASKIGPSRNRLGFD